MIHSSGCRYFYCEFVLAESSEFMIHEQCRFLHNALSSWFPDFLIIHEPSDGRPVISCFFLGISCFFLGISGHNFCDSWRNSWKLCSWTPEALFMEFLSSPLWSLKCVHQLYDPWSVFIPFMIPEACSSPLWSLKFFISSMIPEVCSWMRFAHGSVWSLKSVKLHRSCLYMHSWCFWASLKASLFSPL